MYTSGSSVSLSRQQNQLLFCLSSSREKLKLVIFFDQLKTNRTVYKTHPQEKFTLTNVFGTENAML